MAKKRKQVIYIPNSTTKHYWVGFYGEANTLGAKIKEQEKLRVKNNK